MERELDILRSRLERDFVSRYEMEQLRNSYEMAMSRAKCEAEMAARDDLNEKLCQINTFIEKQVHLLNILCHCTKNWFVCWLCLCHLYTQCNKNSKLKSVSSLMPEVMLMPWIQSCIVSHYLFVFFSGTFS